MMKNLVDFPIKLVFYSDDTCVDVIAVLHVKNGLPWSVISYCEDTVASRFNHGKLPHWISDRRFQISANPSNPHIFKHLVRRNVYEF